jgi:hypothetical protein
MVSLCRNCPASVGPHHPKTWSTFGPVNVSIHGTTMCSRKSPRLCKGHHTGASNSVRQGEGN